MGVSIDETNGDSRETYLKLDISDLYGKGGIASALVEIVSAQKFDDGLVSRSYTSSFLPVMNLGTKLK